MSALITKKLGSFIIYQVNTRTTGFDEARNEQILVERCKLAIPVQVREIRSPQALTDLVYHLCLYNYRRFCTQHSNVAHHVYTDRPYLSSLTDIRFVRECLFLQQLPSLNLFNCALLLSQFSLPSLLVQTADGVQRRCPCLSGRVIAATLQWLAYYSRAPQEG